MRMVDIIEKKRNGKELSKEEIEFFIEGLTNGTIPDYQASAFLMAVYFQDMSDEERANLTLAMVHSGDVIDLSSIEGIKVDKHSTGGVGDTTTLVLAPVVAALDIPFAKMSGRGLGHTGGTIDKLEAFDGFHVELTDNEFTKMVNRDKLSVIGQSGNLTPADKKLYALRDVTATVSSIPLIASSIMSKKIAAGADAIVLDVKTGAGAFMKTEEEAAELASAMVRIGNLVGRNTMAIISDMSQPLGNAIGNSLEVQEAIDTLKGNGPKDLTELVLTLGSQMVVLAGKTNSLEEAKELLKGVINDGSALVKFKQFIKNQGGNPEWVDDPKLLPQARFEINVVSDSEGIVSEIVADAIGVAAMKLGAGRETKEDTIDLAVGLVLRKKVGDPVKKGESLVTIFANQEEVGDVIGMIKENIHIGSDAQESKLIYREIHE
ncbi:pyrimidine-nucleoside phosphorylase [Enterococcus moraviensis ATCC BAA-383]|uniref:Pyrimidine-nucleoside phosphorylase n=1 Tax=Enterococcus moraviensis ATCC BAA-383 TaxID=1158609 RepID=R2T2K2_9ENTE|nr:pyrimidine-nucleoside phosphorylase [Enterococcus moraviensis]EOI01643.1 pyrimidine-nucleoside phosphorylase [Enterococcus moraviensis ATCC BAA-383]EOT73822.1 pyrimidine-nucleoside phosphorylase [Enterococcus moraviensis ATCC BAA-383]